MEYKFMSETLAVMCHIMSSDEDQPIVQDLGVGFDADKNLLVIIDNVDYEDPHYNCSTAAVVSRPEALRLARRLKVQLHQLPFFIGDCMAEWETVPNPTFSQVQDCFKEITECLLDEGCKFRIRRTRGRHGYVCC